MSLSGTRWSLTPLRAAALALPVGLCLAVSFVAMPRDAQAQQDKTDQCAEAAAIVMSGVDARIEGRSLRQTRTMLRRTLDRTAGDELANWIYALPEEALSEQIGTLWQTQCESAL